MFYYVGIDIAKNNHCVAIIDQDCKECGKPRYFTNDAQGFNILANLLYSQGVNADNSLIAMEATGMYWESVYNYLNKQGYKIAVINPLMISSFRGASTTRKTKTDVLDAVLIAKYASFEKPKPTDAKPEMIREIRNLSRFRAKLVKRRTSLINNVTHIGHALFPELPKITGSFTSATTKAIFRKFGCPQTIANTDIRTLTNVIVNASGGAFERQKAIEVKQAAKNTVGTDECVFSLTLEIQESVDLIEALTEKITLIEHKLKELIENSNYKHLLSIPGIGFIHAASIAGEIGIAENFADAKKVIAYAGIDPTTHQSGNFEGNQEHMTKRGNAYLRHTLILAADSARKYDPYFGDYYDSLIKRNKHYYIALSAVARKLSGVILAILKEQRDFEKRPPIQLQNIQNKSNK